MKKTFCIFSIVFLVCAFLGAAEIIVTSPAAGVNWCQRSEHAITWTVAGRMDSNVKIVLRTDRIILTISESTANDGSFTWRVPATVTPGSYVIRVRTVDNTVQGNSPAFNVCPEVLAAVHRPLEMMSPAVVTKTFIRPVNFTTKMKSKESHSWNCLATMGTGPITVPPTEFLVGFFNRRADRGAGCADECVSQVYHGRPSFPDLMPLVGKTIIQASLSIRHKRTEADPACANCLYKMFFYSGRLSETDPPPNETRILAVSISGTYQFDVIDIVRKWLNERNPAYHGELHNYSIEFAGGNERFDFNNQKCLSWFDSGSLEIKYRD